MWARSVTRIVRQPLPERLVAHWFHARRPIANNARNSASLDAEQVEAGRSFLASFTPSSIPQNICDVTFSRSSGPGGQNVNKVNSKATLKVELEDLFKLVPPILHVHIRASPYCTTKSEAIVIQSDESRKQSANREACFAKLYNMVVDAAKAAIPGQTSDSQRERVQNLVKKDNEARIASKKVHSSKKTVRRGKGSSGDY